MGCKKIRTSCSLLARIQTGANLLKLELVHSAWTNPTCAFSVWQAGDAPPQRHPLIPEPVNGTCVAEGICAQVKDLEVGR